MDFRGGSMSQILGEIGGSPKNDGGSPSRIWGSRGSPCSAPPPKPRSGCSASRGRRRRGWGSAGGGAGAAGDPLGGCPPTPPCWGAAGAAPGPAARDLPVYLPHSSPTVPHRLLLLELVPGVGVALLCGPRPPAAHPHPARAPVLEPRPGAAAGLRPAPGPAAPGVLAYLLIHRQQGRTQSGIVRGAAGPP
ncbi:protein fuzzy homolog [Ciconia boyciana]|uniref:protein fuzzy homolog n=1 Tax=Ciconia boyciana TaxID=52775 RepID=UPI003BA2A311